MVRCCRAGVLAIVVSSLPASCCLAAGAAQAESKLTFGCSDERLVECFAWAKAQALAYVRQGDPVGLWYEAALPGRDAFCMRDVSHQAMGAHALGLGQHTLNMLRKFAVNISESKDWCTYWEINCHDKPAPVDYRNDKEFWYNLPANFDVLDACYRMVLWSHDDAYLNDPVFLRFYQHTVTDYIERWDLGLDKVLGRERFMNRDRYDRKDSFQFCRGIPSYHEGSPGMTRLGVDQLAFQAAACRSYGKLLKLRGQTQNAQAFEGKARAVSRFIEENFWDEANDRFNELLLTDGRYTPGGGMQIYLLYNNALTSPDKIDKTLQSVIRTRRINIEIASHYPEVFFRYGAHDEACRTLLQLSNPRTQRRSYPEVSFALVGAIVNGLMGIEPAESEAAVTTYSRLPQTVSWAQVTHVPVYGNLIGVRHNGTTETVFTNHSGKPVTWIAQFAGKQGRLLADGKPVPTNTTVDFLDRTFLSTRLTVEPGTTKTVAYTASP